jgi:outer membrane receptor protein involved in Fe transport
MTNGNAHQRRDARCCLRAAIAGCLLAVAAAPALGQTSSANLRGRVDVNAAPASQAMVRATNTQTGLTRSAQTDASGSYSLAGLPPGTYRVEVNAGGSSKSEVVTLRVGQTATLDLDVGGAAAAPEQPIDSVTVVATHLYETRTSEVASYISPRQIEMLPQNSRNFLAFADIVPGVQFATSTDGSSEIRSGAQSANGVNVFIDGVGQKNYVLRGGVSGQALSRGNPFPQLAIGEYKVITSNYKAEFDQLSSAAIVAATRSGTNDFEAEGFWDKTSEKWRASDPLEAAAGSKAKSEQEQFGAAIGGPIIQDVAHFFVTYERKEFETPRTIRFGRGVTASGELVNELGVRSTPFEEDLIFAKIDWSPGEAHLLELTTKIRDESEIQPKGDETSVGFSSSKDNEEIRWDLRYQYSGASFLNDAHLTYEDAQFNPRPLTLGPGYWLTTGNQDEVIFKTGGGEDYQDKGQSGWGVQDDITFDAFEWMGQHIIKTGVKYKQIEVNAFEQQPYNPQFYYDINNSLTLPYRVRFGAAMPGLPERNVTSRNKQFGVYVQDDWEVNEHLLLNLGVRWDYEETPTYLDFVTPADVVAGLNTQAPGAAPGVTYAQTLALGGVDVNEYISTGANRDAFDGAIQPRLGFSYDIGADERFVVFGGAGRAYDRNVFDYLSLEQSKGTFPTYVRVFNSPGHPCTPGAADCLAWSDQYFDQAALEALVAANPSLGREINLMNNDLKTPYSDQYSLGVRNRLTFLEQDWLTSATLQYIESDDGIVFLLGNRYPNGAFRNNPQVPDATWGSQPWGNGIPGLGTLIVADNGLKTRATSVLLSADKPYTNESGWGVTLAYTYTDAVENRSNVAASDEHYLLDYPSVSDYGWHPSTGVPKHRFVGTAIVDAPWDMTFSAKLTLASPFYYEALNCNYQGTTVDAYCFFQPFKPDTTFGTRQLDIALQKNFDAWSDLVLSVRADVLNVFNYENPNRYETWRGGPGQPPNDAFGDPTGYAQPTRTFKLSFALNW